MQDRVYDFVSATHTLNKDDFPSEELWNRFHKLRKRLTVVEDEQRGSFKATADTLTDKEAHDWLVEFYNISTEIEEAYNSRYLKLR